MADTGGTRMRLRAGDVSWREVGDEAVILESTTGTYLTLNASGKVLWQALEAGATEAEMAAKLAERFGIDSGLAARDAKDFLESLQARSLVEAEPA